MSVCAPSRPTRSAIGSDRNAAAASSADERGAPLRSASAITATPASTQNGTATRRARNGEWNGSITAAISALPFCG